MKILVTGGAGFIGGALVRHVISSTSHEVLNIDKLTYAGRLESLASVAPAPNYHFLLADICDEKAMTEAISAYHPDWVIHLAAETHVDRSIDSARTFVQTNTVGTYTLLEVCRRYWDKLPAGKKNSFRFLHVSTDEVYGSLGLTGLFTEQTPYQPNSPYSASKAGADHLARAWFHTYGIPVVTTNCSNNYGPFQFPEKLIPLCILKAISEEPIPVYGTGENIRDWLYVEDHVRALLCVVEFGEVGQVYNIGGQSERKNIDVVTQICGLLDGKIPRALSPYSNQIKFVADRPGHDQRYAMDISKIRSQLRWEPSESFESGLSKTVDWYLANLQWCLNIKRHNYAGERLGTLEA